MGEEGRIRDWGGVVCLFIGLFVMLGGGKYYLVRCVLGKKIECKGEVWEGIGGEGRVGEMGMGMGLVGVGGVLGGGEGGRGDWNGGERGRDIIVFGMGGWWGEEWGVGGLIF